MWSRIFPIQFSCLRKQNDYGKITEYLQLIDKKYLNKVSILLKKIFDISLKKIFLKNVDSDWHLLGTSNFNAKILEVRLDRHGKPST